MNKKLSTFTIAAAYVGTVVGAGFATGQEVLQFFSYFGIWGFAGIVVATTIFILFGIAIVILGHKTKAKSFLPVISEAGGKWVGRAIDAVVTFFLFGILVTMNAGSGAIFVEQFNLPSLAGSFLMALLTLVTVLLGLRRVIESISIIAPILLFSVLSISIWTILSAPQLLVSNFNFIDTSRAAVPYWFLAAVLYGSYNLVLALPVLAPLGALSTPANLRKGVIWGGIGLGLGVLAISTAILTRAPQIVNLEVPMIAVAQGISPYIRFLYSIVLISEVYTTAVASLYGFGSRLTVPDSKKYKFLAVITSIAALALSQFGFSNLVGTLFPAVGLTGFLLLGALAYNYLKPGLTRKKGIQLSPAGKPFFKRKIE